MGSGQVEVEGGVMEGAVKEWREMVKGKVDEEKIGGK